MDTVVPSNLYQGKGLSSNHLKLIAIITMVIDHSALLFVTSDSTLYIVMRLIGRITAPIMFFMAAAGYHYTRSINRYMVRLAIFSVVSYIPFIFCFYGLLIPNRYTFLNLSVIYTIFLGILAIRIRRADLNNGIKGLLILGIYILSSFGDWGELGISIILVFDIFYGNFKRQFWSYIAVIFIQGGLLSIFTYTVQMLYMGELDFSYFLMSISQFGMILPILLLSCYNGRKGKGGKLAKWGFYIFYPAHLMVLGILASWIST